MINVGIDTLMIVVALEVAAGIVVFLYARERYRRLLTRLERLPGFIWDTVNVVEILRPNSPLVQPGGWAPSADFLAETSRRIIQDKPHLIVELGSGLSTVVTALLLKQRGRGRIVSIDHQAVFAAKTRCQLAANDLTTVAEVRIAPLVETREFGEERQWYDTQALGDLVGIDLLVVDGPPSLMVRDIRYPTLPFFWERLNVGAHVLLDDAARDGERSIIERWRVQFPDMEEAFLDLEKGGMLLRKRG